MSALPPGTFQQRDSIVALAPPYLKTEDEDQEYLYTFGLALDLLLEKMDQAMRAHMPGLCPPSALPLLGNDRVIAQGPAESDDAFNVRLQTAFDAWALAGSRRAVLNQLQSYLANLQPGVAAALPQMLIVGGGPSQTTWDTVYNSTAPGAVPAHAFVSPKNWNWDGVNAQWNAWLVVFLALAPTGISGTNASIASTGGSGVSGVTTGFATITGLSGLSASNVLDYLTLAGGLAHATNGGTFQITSVLDATSCIIANPSAIAVDTASTWSVGHYPFIAPSPVWGSPSFVWGAGSWGLTATLDGQDVTGQVMQSIRGILQAWKGSAVYPNIIFAFGGGDSTAGSEFSPNSAQGSGNPDGTWGGIAKTVAGCRVPARVTGVPLGRFDAFADGTLVAVQCFSPTKG